MRRVSSVAALLFLLAASSPGVAANEQTALALSPPCPGLLPPGPLSAEWTPSGVLLRWSHPLTGPPPQYIVYRLTLTGPSANPRQHEPVDVAVSVGVRDNLPIPDTDPIIATNIPPLTVSAALEVPGAQAIATLPGADTQYLDASANPDGAYLYWVEVAHYGCSGPSSNAAFVGFHYTFPPRIEDCWYFEPPNGPPMPTTDCLDGVP